MGNNDTFILMKNRNDGSGYAEVYDKSNIYCPNCGKQTVYIDRLADYYLGNSGLCVNCGMYHSNAGDFYQIDNQYLLAALKKHFEQATQ